MRQTDIVVVAFRAPEGAEGNCSAVTCGSRQRLEVEVFRGISLLGRDHSTHPAGRIFDVAPVSGDQVHMQVRHGLPRCETAVDADVVPIGTVVLVDELPASPEELSYRIEFLFGGIEKIGIVAFGQDEEVSFGYRYRS